MISKLTIARIIESAHIEEVVSDFLTLKKRGVNFIALCPFHNEKTPSFNVNPARNIFKCFGCGKGGDAVGFIMEHEKMTYPEALRYLAKKYNIEIEQIYNQDAEKEKELESERESLHIVCAFAQKYFSEMLWTTDEGKSIGLNYLKERGLSDTIIQKFQLGYSSENRTAFTDAALKAKYNLNYLVKAGLTIKPEETSPQMERGEEVRRYDRFSGRIIFPVHNITGRVIGFGGRALKKDVKAKYINSPETEIYHKSSILYGLPFARKAIAIENNCYLVEGYMDVISLHQSGIENVVASSGTSLTVEQIRLIKRYTNNITIMYDRDSAGIKASFRGIDLALKEGYNRMFQEELNIRLVEFPDGEDPDSYARKVSESELRTYIKEHTIDFIRYKTTVQYEEIKNDPIKKSSFIHEMMESIASMPNNVIRSLYIQQFSVITKVDEQVLITELNKILRSRYAKERTNNLGIEEIVDLDNPPVPQPIDLDLDTTEYHEQEIIRLLLLYGDKPLNTQTDSDSYRNQDEEVRLSPKNESVYGGETDSDTSVGGNKHFTPQRISVLQFIREHLSLDNIRFENELFQKIFDEYSSAFSSKGGSVSGGLTQENLPLEHFIHHENLEISKIAIDLTTFPYSLSDWEGKRGIMVKKEGDLLETAALYAIYSFKIKKINKMILDIQFQLQGATSEEEVFTLIAQQKRFENSRKDFAKALGWVVLK